MTKKPLLISLIILTVITAGAFYLLTSSPDDASTQNSVDSAQQGTSAQPSATMEMRGKYADYTEGAISNTTGTKLLFFHAAWCPQCRDLEADITQKGVPSGVTIFKVDYDTNQSLRQKYGVTLQTTIVKVDDTGKLIDKFVAYEEPSVDALIKNLL